MNEKLIYQSNIHLNQFIKGELISRGSNFLIQLYQSFNFESKFIIFNTKTNEIALETKIELILNFLFKTNEKILFFDIEFNNKLYNFCINFISKTELHGFIDYFIILKFENIYKKKISIEDKEEINRFKTYNSLDEYIEDNNTKIEEEFYLIKGDSDEGINKFLQISKKNKNSFVLRKYLNKSDLGVFSLDKNCNYKMSLPNLLKNSNEPLLVNDMMLFNNDNNLLLLDENSNKSIFNIDLNRGEIINKFDCKDSNNLLISINKLLPESLNENNSNTFIGFNEKDTFRFDPRSNLIVDKSTYKTNNKFISGLTTFNGKLIMGSLDGIIRLYSSPCKKRATINFQVNTGSDPILFIDVSPDENWVLITCPYYLSIVNVLNSNNGKLAFDSPMGQNKPPLKRLSIKPEHQQKIAQYNNNIMPKFINSKFEIQNNKIISIIAGIGTGLIIWDFKRILDGKLPTYKIKLLGGENIIDDNSLIPGSELLIMSNNQISVINI